MPMRSNKIIILKNHTLLMETNSGSNHNIQKKNQKIKIGSLTSPVICGNEYFNIILIYQYKNKTTKFDQRILQYAKNSRLQTADRNS